MEIEQRSYWPRIILERSIVAMRFFRSLLFLESENKKKRLTRAVSKIEEFIWLVCHSLHKEAQTGALAQTDSL